MTGPALHISGDAIVQNCLITASGSGITLAAGGALDLSHSTVADHGGAGVNNLAGRPVTISESIVCGNAGGDLLGVGCASVSLSDICSQDCSGGNGNLSADPSFVCAGPSCVGPRDYHVQPASPILDRGPSPASFTGQPCFDLDGGPRLRDHDGDGLARLDMGSYERPNLLLHPPEIVYVRWLAGSPTSLTWDTAPGAIEYHIYRGSLSGLTQSPYGYFGTCRDDLDADRTDLLLTDMEVPAPGVGHFYIITAEDAGTGGGIPRARNEGTLGYATCAERSNFAPCP